MRSLWRKIRATGRVAEPAPAAPIGDLSDPRRRPHYLAGSVQFRHVDTGSCNGCEIEIGAAFGPVYDVERYGARLVASPRHADALLVTGPVTRNMAEPLRRTYEAVSGADAGGGGRVIAPGTAACSPRRTGWPGRSAPIVPVDLEIPGCPPRPEAIVAAIRRP